MAHGPITNPFHHVYYAEGIGADEIPLLFSPKLVPFVSPLFAKGNVALRGMEGTGKTMLLSLLDTKVRLAFWNHPDGASEGELSKGDPLKPHERRFVGAGINLSSSKAFKLNEIRVSENRDQNIQLSRQYFGDFLNSWIVRDLFTSIETLIAELKRRRASDRFDQIGLCPDLKKLNAVVKKMSKDSACAFLSGAKTVEDLRQILGHRIAAYLKLVSDPQSTLSAEMNDTRRLLGEPVEVAVQSLQSLGVLADDTNVFVTIDQFEQLIRRRALDGDDERHWRFIHEIEDLISLRSQNVSYRIGTRPNATLTRCDANRDYFPLDLDVILQRRESVAPRSNSLIHPFAEDAFRRRIAISEHPSRDLIVAHPTPLKLVYGSSPDVAERGRLCQPKRGERVLRPDKQWPEEVTKWLQRLAKEDVIAASLGEAWVRQQAARGEVLNVAGWDTPNPLPWETPEKRWWKKERLPSASLQVAAANAQRLIYYGEKDLIQLSGDNIVAFISLCREIWECDARYRTSSAAAEEEVALEFDRKRQSEGIRDASRKWREKMTERPNGDSMQRFVDELGNRLRKQLIEDRQMSYPGANGISLTEKDLKSDHALARLLDDTTAECFLLQRDHTPKNRSRGKSIKWYLHPILAPFYQLTVQHTKEPLYLTTKKLREWLKPCGLLAAPEPATEAPPKSKSGGNRTAEKVPKSASQKTLWPEDE